MRRLMTVLALAASTCGSTSSGPTRYVKLEKNERGERGALPVWKSSDSMQRCLTQGMRRLDQGALARQAFDGGACADGRVGNLGHGTAVESLAASAECGVLAKIRVREGELKGRVGCVPPEVLTAERVP